VGADIQREVRGKRKEERKRKKTIEGDQNHKKVEPSHQTCSLTTRRLLATETKGILKTQYVNEKGLTTAQGINVKGTSGTKESTEFPPKIS